MKKVYQEGMGKDKIVCNCLKKIGLSSGTCDEKCKAREFKKNNPIMQLEISMKIYRYFNK